MLLRIARSAELGVVAGMAVVSMAICGPARAEVVRAHWTVRAAGSDEIRYVASTITRTYEPGDPVIARRAEGPAEHVILVETTDLRRFVIRWWQADDGEHCRLAEHGREAEAIEFVSGRRVRDVSIGGERIELPSGAEEWELQDLWHRVRALPSWHLLAAAEELSAAGLFPAGQQEVRALFCSVPPTRSDARHWECSARSRVVETELPADCEFDATFGFPCGEGK
jgi:hypothetical protein